jgi:hypothetical protein
MLNSGSKRERGAQKKSKKQRGHRDEDVDENASVHSDDSWGAESAAPSKQSVGGAAGDIVDDKTEEDKQDELVEQLAEKRSSTRASAMTKLVDELQTSYAYDFVSSRLETLQMYLLNSVRKGDSSEVALACKCLNLMALTLGAESDSLATAATPLLHDVMKNPSKGAGARTAAAEAIGFVNFFGCMSDDETLSVMTMLTDLLKAQQNQLPEPTATALLNSWGLLASTLSASRLSGDIREMYLPLLMRYLDHESTDVKTAAGECIALIWEAKQETDGDEPDAEGETSDEESKPKLKVKPTKQQQAADDAAAAQEQKEKELDALEPLPESAVPVEPASTSPPSATDDARSRGDSVSLEDSLTSSPSLSSSEARVPSMRPRADSIPEGPTSGTTMSPVFTALNKPFKFARPGPSSRATGGTVTGAPTAAAAGGGAAGGVGKNEKAPAGGGAGSRGKEISVDQIIDKLSSLATDSSRQKGKKERAEQKKSFRDILKSVELGETPSESLKIEKSRHEFSGWSQIKQLNSIRDVVGKGLNTHFVCNDVLREIFDLYIESGEGVDDPSRKAHSRAISAAKARENFEQRAKQRKKKQALIHAGEED